jgi:hypothetical protein
MVGVIQPGYTDKTPYHSYLDLFEVEDLDGEYVHCFYNSHNGLHNDVDAWRGGLTEPATAAGDRIGLLLDLDQGSMTVYKNDERLGVMRASGLNGEYSWAVELTYPGQSVRIEPAPLP